MLLTDASRHDWLEGRGPRLTLIGFQDDATSRALAARFQLEAENATGYFRCMHTLFTTHGIPLSLYRDRHGIFQRNDPHWSRQEELAGQQFPTQLGRALEELGIQQIPANSPQAKGRIERLGVPFGPPGQRTPPGPGRSLDQANAVLTAFLPAFEHNFAVPAAQSLSEFRPLPRSFRFGSLSQLPLSAGGGQGSHPRLGRRSFSASSTAYPAPSLAGKVVGTVAPADGSLRFYFGQQLLLTLQRPLAES